MNDDRPVRPPGVSISELVMRGHLCESEVRSDGRVSELSRLRAERDYYVSEVGDLTGRRRRRNRPQSARTRRTHMLDSEASRPQSASARRQDFVDQHIQVQTDVSREHLKCCICFGNERQIAFAPCFHFCVCSACAERVHFCPLCRTFAEEKHRIWL